MYTSTFTEEKITKSAWILAGVGLKVACCGCILVCPSTLDSHPLMDNDDDDGEDQCQDPEPAWVRCPRMIWRLGLRDLEETCTIGLDSTLWHKLDKENLEVQGQFERYAWASVLFHLNP
jgi:hypothetical protein